MALAERKAGPKTLVIETVKDLRDHICELRLAKKTVGFVPTMGALHVGHMSLVERARKECDVTVLSVFVNPLQFNRKDDLDRYPRVFEQDLDLCGKNDVAVIYTPPESEIYPKGFMSKVQVGEITTRWEGAHRPGHFDGMATVVTKLLLMVMPDKAYFGEKDFQQLLVVKKLVSDLNIPTEIVAVPTFREKDGLAYSSRNTLLSPEQREIAPALHKAMKNMAEKIKKGFDPARLSSDANSELRNAGFDRIDYIAAVDAETLTPLNKNVKSGRIIAAAWLGNVRLIDNISIETGN